MIGIYWNYINKNHSSQRPDTCAASISICFFSLCSVGHLEVSSVVGVGVWTRTACQSLPTARKKVAWVVKMHKASTETEEAGVLLPMREKDEGTPFRV